MARGLSCSVACGILVPRPGIELMSPALEGRFLTTGPTGKSLLGLFLNSFLFIAHIFQASVFFFWS